jgi:hypothetical protein
MKFTYGSGSRPLDGYTIKRGVGRGGFGEVYFAVSDGGKEVALKLVRGDGEVELRGIAQCLNLKHPNLVALFDLRTDRDGNQWVVMEYVAGEPLHAVLGRHPKGLPRELTQQWFTALARAVGYLHDHGIVHRDLKPANIFIENGLLKVGDYGLCKSMSTSQRGQTQSVGTVHYMAPEISTGNYGRQIDVYACGILLYEMLTGRVPFDGESAGEILMKHLTTTPDLSGVPFEYVPIVSKALAKNPTQRYESLAEMAQAVESIGRPGAAPVVRPAPPRVMARSAEPAAAIEQVPSVVAAPAVSIRGQVGELSGSMAMAAVLALLTTMVLWAAFLQNIPRQQWSLMFFLTVALSWAVLIPGKFWTAQRDRERWGRRLAMGSLGALIGLGAMWLEGWTPAWPLHRNGNGSMAQLLGPGDPLGVTASAGFLAYFGLGLGALRWWKMTDRRRKHWFSLFPLLAAGFWGGVLLFMLPNYDQRSVGFASMVMAAAIVQCVSPWETPPPPSPRRLRLRYA